MRLSVLDQTPVPKGTTPREALSNTVELAQLAERLGYERYWLAEHHASAGLAGSVPEVLIAHVAAHTSRIRVGSGGVMLSHYSPLKVAEAFRMLESLHPGRIDLGLGRAPGSEPITAFALQRNRQHQNSDDFVDQLAELMAWLEESFPEQHPFSRITATPVPDAVPDVWLLSSSGYSSSVAAHFGTGLCFAHFISEEFGPEAIADYKSRFVPSVQHPSPAAAIGVGVICAETDDEAATLATSGHCGGCNAEKVRTARCRTWKRQRCTNGRAPICWSQVPRPLAPWSVAPYGSRNSSKSSQRATTSTTSSWSPSPSTTRPACAPTSCSRTLSASRRRPDGQPAPRPALLSSRTRWASPSTPTRTTTAAITHPARAKS